MHSIFVHEVQLTCSEVMEEKQVIARGDDELGCTSRREKDWHEESDVLQVSDSSVQLGVIPGLHRTSGGYILISEGRYSIRNDLLAELRAGRFFESCA